MSVYSIVSTTSGIPEGMESGISTSTEVPILIGILGVAIAVGFVLSRFLKKYNESFIVGVLISLIIIGVPGFLVSMSFANSTREDLDAAVLRNIEENYDIQDISVGNPEEYKKDEHRVPISATQNGQFIEFEAVYSEEYDLMIPVKTNVDNITVKDGSDLEVIMNQEN